MGAHLSIREHDVLFPHFASPSDFVELANEAGGYDSLASSKGLNRSYPSESTQPGLVKLEKADVTDPRTWLQEQGFDSDGDLRLTIEHKDLDGYGKRNTVCRWQRMLFEKGAGSFITTGIDVMIYDHRKTSIQLSCEYGQVDVAKWLFDKGANVRTMEYYGWTPMHLACVNGHLDVAKWLFEAGAAGDICAKSKCGRTPMHAACWQGRLEVTKWLYEVGAADDIRSCIVIDGDNHLDTCMDFTPLHSASGLHHSLWGRGIFSQHHTDTMIWLVLQGAANIGNSSAISHVDSVVLARDVQSDASRLTLLDGLTAIVNTHSTFTRLVLPAIQVEKGSANQLSLMCGYEDTLMVFIADFAGVVRGRQLRNAREAAGALAARGRWSHCLPHVRALYSRRVQSSEALIISNSFS